MEDGDLTFQRDDEGVSFAPRQQPVLAQREVSHGENLAARMSGTNLDAISNSLTETIAHDEEGMVGVEDIAEEVVDLMGLGPEGKPDTDDDNCDTSSHPLMLTAIMRFQAKAIAALLPADDMAVRTEPVEDIDLIEDEKEREQREEELNEIERRVQAFYTNYLFERLPSYEDDMDQTLAQMGQMGLGIRKIVVDRSRRDTPVQPETVRPGSLIVSYDTRNFRMGRYTHKVDLDTGSLIRRMNSGMYRPIELVDQSAPDVSRIQAAQDEVYGFKAGHYQSTGTHRLHEVYTSLFLRDDPHPNGLPRPYIVTIHTESRDILAIQRNWDPQDPDENPMEHFVGYLYHPGRSAVTGVGLGQILMQTTKALRSAQRRMLEAGYLQNHPSGFKLGNLTIRDGETRVRAGEFVDVDTPTGDIRNAIMMQPFQGPSQGLMALSTEMKADGRELGGIATVDFSQLMKAGIAAGPAMAAFEESTEFQNAAHRRLYKAHRKELEIVHDRMKTVMGDRTVLFGVDQQLQKGDLQAVKVLPYMKPGQSSKQKTIMEAQAVWDLARENSDVMDKRRAAENYIRALGSPEADRLILPDPEEEEVKPANLVSEYVAVLAGKPIRAGLSQNHQAHIDGHTAQLKMLQTSQLPIEAGDAASAILAAHISEHIGMQLMVEVASITGIPIDQLGPEMPLEMEAQIAPAIAQAVAQIEEMRRPPDGEDSKVQIQQIKEAGATQREQMKSQTKLTEAGLKVKHDAERAQMDHRHKLEQQERDNQAAMAREIESGGVDMAIARMKTGGAGRSE